jgi:hypothetical protein
MWRIRNKDIRKLYIGIWVGTMKRRRSFEDRANLCLNQSSFGRLFYLCSLNAQCYAVVQLKCRFWGKQHSRNEMSALGNNNIEAFDRNGYVISESNDI